MTINISWSAETTRRVSENYTLFFDEHNVVVATMPYFVYEQNTSDSNIICRSFVTAVNGAGESDPSDNVTIPSLPDIGSAQPLSCTNCGNLVATSWPMYRLR